MANRPVLIHRGVIPPMAGILTAIFTTSCGPAPQTPPTAPAQKIPAAPAPSQAPAPQPNPALAPAPQQMPSSPLFKTGDPEFQIPVWSGQYDAAGQKVNLMIGIDADMLGPGGVLTVGFLAQMDPHLVKEDQLNALAQSNAMLWRQKMKLLQDIEAHKASTEPKMIAALSDYLNKSHGLTPDMIEKIRANAALNLKPGAEIQSPQSAP